jgi:hypothetical protein
MDQNPFLLRPEFCRRELETQQRLCMPFVVSPMMWLMQ